MIATSKKPLRKRIKFGDIVEIATPAGFAYAQYTHRHDRPPRFGALIRVLPGLFSERPKDFKELVNQKERFYVFFPVTIAVSRGIVQVVGHEEIPERCKPFPLFKAGNRSPITGKVETWWLWDGERGWRIGNLKPEHYDLPMKEIVNDTMLVHLIVSGWSSRDEV
jgi:hypothetical protein